MNASYNTHYKTEDYFGDPYPELIDFLSGISPKGRLIDLGCGQGRDAIPLAKLGYKVTGIDNSSVGIEQMARLAQAEGLAIKGIVGDFYSYKELDKYDIILLDSMFHFAKKDKEKETGFLKDVLNAIKVGAMIVICLHNTGNIIKTLLGVMNKYDNILTIKELDFNYTFNDPHSDHQSVTSYKMVAYKKTEDHIFQSN